MSHPSGPFRRASNARPGSEGAVGEHESETDVMPRFDDAMLDQFDSANPGSGRVPVVAPGSGPFPTTPPKTPGSGGIPAVPPRFGQEPDPFGTEPDEEPEMPADPDRSAFVDRLRKIMVLLAVMVFCSGAVAFGAMKLMHWQGPGRNFAGPAGPVVVVRVRQGDTAEQIAQTMVDKGVVATSSVFYKAAVRNDAMSSLQPGYYAVPSHVTGSRAVTALVAKGARVGNVVLSDGRQLLDSHDASTRALKEGIYTKIATASCYGPAGRQHCVTHDQLLAAGATPDLAALGVPGWATEAVRQVPDHQRQLEGLIAAGVWDFDPSASPIDILRQLVSASAARYESTGLLNAGASTHSTPYQMLIAASLVEREALPQDMPKVARVIFNRLNIVQPLEFDSTVNYDLPETAVATTDQDRARNTPWNTYAQAGLPATPISSPSLDALRAVENPTPGNWRYFVTIDKQGDTRFTADYQEHLRNIKLAEESGILDSGPQCPQSGCPR